MTDSGGALDRYLGEIRQHPLLSRDEECELAARIREGDREALDRLVGANLRFVVTVARRYAHRGIPLDELINEGNLGLIEAARRFDETRGVRFVSYAVWWIRQSVLGALARETRIVRVPAGRIERARVVARTARVLRQRLGRSASPGDIAAELDLTEEQVREALDTRRSYVSLDAPLGGAGDASLLDLLPDEASDPQLRVDRGALETALRDGLGRLPEREAGVVRAYYGLEGCEPATLSEIGTRLGVSRERAGMIRERALKRLRLGAEGRELRAFRIP
ncbi:MAG: sigma-70 family RNA polymerase sigma factor [Gemmatimonadota bacterium]